MVKILEITISNISILNNPVLWTQSSVSVNAMKARLFVWSVWPSQFSGKINFGGSYLQFTNFKSISNLPDNIQNDKITSNKMKHANLENFDSRAINALTKKMNKIK